MPARDPESNCFIGWKLQRKKSRDEAPTNLNNELCSLDFRLELFSLSESEICSSVSLKFTHHLTELFKSFFVSLCKYLALY